MIYAGTDEVLNKVLQVIAEGLTVPGADTDVLEQLQDVIVIHFQNKAKELGARAAQMAGQQPTQQGMNQGGSPMQIQPGGGSGMSGMGVPNPDELRRVLGATGQVR